MIKIVWITIDKLYEPIVNILQIRNKTERNRSMCIIYRIYCTYLFVLKIMLATTALESFLGLFPGILPAQPMSPVI